MPFQTNIPAKANPGTVVLSDADTGSFAEIYTFGALLNKFCCNDGMGLVNVVNGYHSPEEARMEITSTFRSAKLSPFAGRLINDSYHFGERYYHLENCTGGSHAMHGLLCNKEFSIAGTRADDLSSALKLVYAYDNNEEGYPFKYRCEVEYELQPNNMLKLTTCVYNTGEKLLPVADGWHPYFTLGDNIDDYQLEFQSKQLVVLDKNRMPTGEMVPYHDFTSITRLGDVQFDDCFVLNFAECQPLCVIRNPKNRLAVEIRPSRSYPYLQIYTPPNRKSIALQNLSAVPDAFNNGIGLRVLEPGQADCFTTTFIIKTY